LRESEARLSYVSLKGRPNVMVGKCEHFLGGNLVLVWIGKLAQSCFMVLVRFEKWNDKK